MRQQVWLHVVCVGRVPPNHPLRNIPGQVLATLHIARTAEEVHQAYLEVYGQLSACYRITFRKPAMAPTAECRLEIDDPAGFGSRDRRTRPGTNPAPVRVARPVEPSLAADFALREFSPAAHNLNNAVIFRHMILKSFFGETVESALRLARQELGSEAMFIQSNKTTSEYQSQGDYEAVFAVPDPEPPAVAAGTSSLSAPPEPVNRSGSLADEVAQLHKQMDLMAGVITGFDRFILAGLTASEVAPELALAVTRSMGARIAAIPSPTPSGWWLRSGRRKAFAHPRPGRRRAWTA